MTETAVLQPGQNSLVIRCEGSEVPAVIVSGDFEDPIIIAPGDPSIIDAAGHMPLGSAVVDIDLASEGRVPRTELCFRVHRDVDSDSCLGFIDESRSPPEWMCEDSCLDISDGQACGVTDHFTNFAILLDGGGVSGHDPCDSNSSDFITGEWWGDVVLTGTVLLVCAGCALAFAVLVTFFPPVRDVFRGPEGTRALAMRTSTDTQLKRTIEAAAKTIAIEGSI